MMPRYNDSDPRKFTALCRRIANWLDQKYYDKPFFRDISIQKAWVVHRAVTVTASLLMLSGLLLIKWLSIVGVVLMTVSVPLLLVDAFICTAYLTCQFCGLSFLTDRENYPRFSYCVYCGKKLGPRDSDSI